MSGYRLRRAGALAVLVTALLGCAAQEEREIRVVSSHSPVNRQGGITYKGVPLFPGQLVLTEHGDAMSLLMTVGLTRFRPFTHAGILVVEDGEPYVYDLVGSLGLNRMDPPTDGIHGGVQSRPLDRVIRRNRVVAVYDPPPGTHPGRMVTYSWKSALSDIDFDPYFDYDDRRRLYCTEFVAVAVQQAGGEPPDPIPLRGNPSLGVVFRWLKIRAPRILAAGSFAVPDRHVATFTSGWTEAEIAAYFAAKREIHRRFTADQRLGHLFRWEGNSLELRPGVVEFREQALQLARSGELASRPEAVGAAVQKLAKRFFSVYR